MFSIDGLDHVAIRVKDIDLSCEWYARVLGLKRYDVEAWGPFPVFMLSGQSGVAIFPSDGQSLEAYPRALRIDHFAFRVDSKSFREAQEHFNAQGIDFIFQDHIHFHSVYLKDPDGHTVELTTLIGEAKDFYK